MKNKKTIYFIAVGLLFLGCSSSENEVGSSGNNNGNGTNPNEPTNNWLIPINEVADGGPGKDGIPSIDNPIFVSASEATNLSNDELIVGVKIGNEAKAYPHFILDWHEIVNDQFGESNLSLSYCPLTGTAFLWPSQVANVSTSFGTSGLLYNSNLILYDRATDSNWSQMRIQCVNGSQIGTKPQTLNIIETNWATWKAMYPNSEVLTTQTGFNRPYNTYPYGNYKTNHDFFLFQPSILNPELPNKKRVFTLIDEDMSKVYKFEDFAGGKVIKDFFNGKTYLIVGNENVINAFALGSQFSNLDFSYSFNNSEIFFNDNEGNGWSIFGRAISGPRINTQLSTPTKVTSMWFAVAVFYPNPVIYQN